MRWNLSLRPCIVWLLDQICAPFPQTSFWASFGVSPKLCINQLCHDYAVWMLDLYLANPFGFLWLPGWRGNV